MEYVRGEPIAAPTEEELPLQSAYRHERERPDAPFLFQPLGGGQVDVYDWRRTMDAARRIARWLESKELPKGSRVALVSKNCAQHFIFDLAIWMAGHVSVAIYPTMGPDSLRFVLEHSESSLLFVGKLDDWAAMRSGVPDGLELVTCALGPEIEGAARWDDILAQNEPIQGEPVRDRDDTLLLMYTSGSTGLPKGVEATVEQSVAWARSAKPLLQVTADDRMMSYLPLAHSMERNGLLVTAFCIGFQVHFVESLDTFIDDLKRAKPTVFHSVPRLWLKFKAGVEAKMPSRKLARLLRIPLFGTVVRKKVLSGLGLECCRMAFTASAPIPAEILRWYLDLGLELLEAYAMTENCVVCTMTRPGKIKPGWVGEPLPGVELRISAEGEIQTRGPGVMKGYYKDPARTAETFTHDGWLRTGDRGEIDADGAVRITGRVKELFKTSKGKYIAPAPIENMLNTSGVIEQSCVMGLGLPQPFAVAMLSEPARERVHAGDRDAVAAEVEAVLDQLNAQLPGYERLRNLVVTLDEWSIANGLLTPTMKIKRSAIEERYAQYLDEEALPIPGVLMERAEVEAVLS